MIQKKLRVSNVDLRQQNMDYAIAITHRDEKIRMLQQAIQELEAQLYSERTAKAALKRLAKGLDSRMLNYLHTKGIKRLDTVKDHPVIESVTPSSYQRLIDQARAYDIDEFFTPTKSKAVQNMKLPYYLLISGYLGVRNTSIHIAKRVYRKKAH